jgi:hypothetical protein
MVGCDYDAFRLTGCCRSDRVANKHSGQLWPLRGEMRRQVALTRVPSMTW